MQQRRSVVIVGDGFAEMTAARELAGALPAIVDRTLVFEENETSTDPLLPPPVAASLSCVPAEGPRPGPFRPDGRSGLAMDRVAAARDSGRLLPASPARLGIATARTTRRRGAEVPVTAGASPISAGSVALGDWAAVRNAKGGQLVKPAARVGVRRDYLLAHNICSILAGLPAHTVERKLRILAERAWVLVFPSEVTPLHSLSRHAVPLPGSDSLAAMAIAALPVRG